MKIRPLHDRTLVTTRSLIAVAVLGSLAAACTTATPRLLDQSAAIVSAVVHVVPDQAPAIAAAGIRARPSQAAAITAAAVAAAPDQADAIARAAIATEPGQAEAIVRAAALAVDMSDSVSALPRQALTGRIDTSTSDAAREFMRRERTIVMIRVQSESP
jgi:hypothetical protein